MKGDLKESMLTIGICFNIDKISSSFYGSECWKVFWQTIEPKDLLSSILYEGDTEATLCGKEQVFCIAVQTLNGQVIEEIKEAFLLNTQFKKICSATMFIEGRTCINQPLALSLNIDVHGKLSGQMSTARQAWAEVSRKKNKEMSEKEMWSYVLDRIKPASPRTANLPEWVSNEEFEIYLKKNFSSNDRDIWVSPEELCDIVECYKNILQVQWQETSCGYTDDMVIIKLFFDTEIKNEARCFEFRGLWPFHSNQDVQRYCEECHWDVSDLALRGTYVTKFEGILTTNWISRYSHSGAEEGDEKIVVDLPTLWAKICYRLVKAGLQEKPLINENLSPDKVKQSKATTTQINILKILMDAMCCVMCADKKVSISERKAIHTVLQKTKLSLSTEEIENKISDFINRVKKEGLNKIIQDTCDGLHLFSKKGKDQILLKCLDYVASADGVIDEREKKLCEKFRLAIQQNPTPNPASDEIGKGLHNNNKKDDQQGFNEIVTKSVEEATNIFFEQTIQNIMPLRPGQITNYYFKESELWKSHQLFKKTEDEMRVLIRKILEIYADRPSFDKFKLLIIKSEQCAMIEAWYPLCSIDIRVWRGRECLYICRDHSFDEPLKLPGRMEADIHKGKKITLPLESAKEKNIIQVTPDPFGHAIKDLFDYISQNHSNSSFSSKQLPSINYSMSYLKNILIAQPHNFSDFSSSSFNNNMAKGMILKVLRRHNLIEETNDDEYLLTDNGKNTVISIKHRQVPSRNLPGQISVGNRIMQVVDFRTRKERKAQKKGYSQKSLGKKVDKLVDELVNIGLREGFLSDKPGGGFDNNHRNIRAQEISEKLFKKGGESLLLIVRNRIHALTSQGGEFDYMWEDIRE